MLPCTLPGGALRHRAGARAHLLDQAHADGDRDAVLAGLRTLAGRGGESRRRAATHWSTYVNQLLTAGRHADIDGLLDLRNDVLAEEVFTQFALARVFDSRELWRLILIECPATDFACGRAAQARPA